MSNQRDRSELSEKITRRDFVGATLVGSGAMLLSQACPAAKSFTSADAWTGYGGVGDYRFANGNTASVVEAAHRIRDRVYQSERAQAIDIHEDYDVVIVGGGFAGLAALYEFRKRRPQGKCLLLENHSIFGGFAKSNEFDVDGYRIAAPQASCDFFLPKRDPARDPSEAEQLWYDLGLPEDFRFARQESGGDSIKFSKSTSAAMYWAEHTATVGYYFQSDANGQGSWVKDIWDDDLKRTPWPDSLKQELLKLRDSKLSPPQASDTWLDSMSYSDFITREMKLSSRALSYFEPIMNVIGSVDVSAYAARRLSMPGVSGFNGRSPFAAYSERFMSFPGGNATILRHFVKDIFPDAISGPKNFEAIAGNAVDLAKLDRAESNCRMRLNATVLGVEHERDPQRSEHVHVTYEKGGRLYRVKAGGVVVGAGSWIAKHIVHGLPDTCYAALNMFHYAPVLMVNVALRNWRFLDALGFSSARWFDGFGFYGTVIHPMIIGNRPVPFHPDKPIVMTFYVPISVPKMPLAMQGPAARAALFSTPYATYERQIIAQMKQMFSAGGFEPSRDVAGIILNRWGHARLSPPPGFYFGKEGMSPPLHTLQQSFARVAFGSSELSGLQSWTGAVTEGKRSMQQVLGVL